MLLGAMLVELWTLKSDQRLGQLVVNVMRSQRRRLELADLPELEDSELWRVTGSAFAAAACLSLWCCSAYVNH